LFLDGSTQERGREEFWKRVTKRLGEREYRIEKKSLLT
jgi:hypothetical protein